MLVREHERKMVGIEVGRTEKKAEKKVMEMNGNCELFRSRKERDKVENVRHRGSRCHASLTAG